MFEGGGGGREGMASLNYPPIPAVKSLRINSRDHMEWLRRNSNIKTYIRSNKVTSVYQIQAINPYLNSI